MVAYHDYHVIMCPYYNILQHEFIKGTAACWDTKDVCLVFFSMFFISALNNFTLHRFLWRKKKLDYNIVFTKHFLVKT